MGALDVLVTAYKIQDEDLSQIAAEIDKATEEYGDTLDYLWDKRRKCWNMQADLYQKILDSFAPGHREEAIQIQKERDALDERASKLFAKARTDADTFLKSHIPDFVYPPVRCGIDKPEDEEGTENDS